MLYEYLIIELFLLVIGIAIHKFFFVRIFSSRKQMFFFWIISFTVGIIWDHFAIARGHWIYPAGSVVGIFFWKMPLEDYLFMFLYPYYALLTYRLLKSKHFFRK
jgi:lycopene cyclase domain-containing protein